MKLALLISWALICVKNARKCQVPAIKRATIESNEIVKAAKLATKFFNFPCDTKPLKMFKNICCNISLDNTKGLGNL